MSLTKKIKDLALIAGLSATITGCATTSKCPTPLNPSKIFSNQEQSKRSNAISVLKTSKLEYLPGGYITDRWGKSDLIETAGFIAGTIDVVETENGYFSTGTYSQFEDPEALLVAAKYSDSNGDKIVTEKEARNYKFNLFENYVRGNENE